MGRFNRQTGEFTAKPSIQKKIQRMYGPIEFEQALRKGTPVKLFTGAGWEKCAITSWSKDRVTAKAVRGGRSITCYDARNMEVL